jgi:alkylation response protein AidB-like acyl-CoA dehydrogenase
VIQEAPTAMSESQPTFDPVARARALQPLVREHAAEAERERRLPTPVAEAMARAGLYRVSAPRSFQGAEMDPATQIETIEAIAYADGATGWNLMIGIESFGLLSLNFPQGKDLFADPLAILSSSTAAVGAAEVADGGFRVSGDWQFVSGCHNCHFFGGLVSVRENGEALHEPPRFALVPREEIEIVDTWNVAGLCGSGSHDVRVRDAFVPEERTTSLVAAPGARGDNAFARIPTGSRLAYNKVGVALGIARAAIDDFVELATGKTPRFTSTRLRERAFAQRAVANAEARLRGARAFVMEAVTELWDGAVAGERPSDHQRALLQIACSDAARASAEAVDLVMEAAGTSANWRDSPLERRVRDVKVIRQHVTVAPHHIEDAGRVLLGLPPEQLMLQMAT